IYVTFILLVALFFTSILFILYSYVAYRALHSFPTRRSSDLFIQLVNQLEVTKLIASHDLEMILQTCRRAVVLDLGHIVADGPVRSEEHTSELQSRGHLVCRLLLEKKNKSNQKNQLETHSN